MSGRSKLLFVLTVSAAPEVVVRLVHGTHPWMKAYIGVTAHPHDAVTGKAGNFELTGLPPTDEELSFEFSVP